MIIKTRSYARAGLLGNPSDGYFGKTISFTFKNFFAEVTLYESPSICFMPGEVDDNKFTSHEHLLEDIQLFGYYGGIRLLKAITKLFFIYCKDYGIHIEDKNFTASYSSNIPRLVGLSGSSAICTAMLKALCIFYNVQIPQHLMPTICLEAERDELDIQCGLQDRVIQIYEGCVFMDFDKNFVERNNYGIYQQLGTNLLKNIYIAYDPNRAEISGKYHKKLKVLFDEQKPDIVSAMKKFASFAEEGKTALMHNDNKLLAQLINKNFDLRDKIFNVSNANRNMVHTARETGASAKFAGSGGAIVGTYENERQYDALKERLSAIGCNIVKPVF